MPIIDLQRRLVEVGRIRMGTSEERQRSGGGTFRVPVRLGTWRLTSRDRVRLEAAAQVYGGEVVPWDVRAGEFELITELDSLPVAVLPGQNISIWYELWGQRAKKKPIECFRRCDGQTETITDGPCICDPDARECKPSTRLSVLLLDVPGVGCWRFDSHGYYAAVELAGTVELLERLTASGHPYPARLRIDQRSQVKDGETVKFPVPVLDIDAPMRMAMAAAFDAPALAPAELGAPAPAALELEQRVETSTSTSRSGLREGGHTPIAAPAGTTVADGLAAVAAQVAPAARTGRSAEPVGVPAPAPIPAAAVPVPDDETAPLPAPAPAATEAGPEALPAPDGETLHDETTNFGNEAGVVAASPAAPTAPMLKKLNVLIGTLRDRRQVLTNDHLYLAVAVLRSAHDPDAVIDQVGGRDDAGLIHWAPLRDSLTRAEAQDLIDRLQRLDDNTKGGA